MPDFRFFPPAGPFTLGDLARIAGAELGDGDDPGRSFANVAPLDSAAGDDVSFLDNRRYVDEFRATGAGCCVVAPRDAGEAPPGTALLVAERPYAAYARVAAAFHPDADRMYVPTGSDPPVHDSAVVGRRTIVGIGTVIGPGAEIGEDCTIGPNVYIGQGVKIGDRCRIAPLVSVRYALIGDRVTLSAGVRIGEPGFGFAISDGDMVTVPQLGRVVIGDGVEIGANSAVDRGAGPDTVIGEGTRIDNLVQIGHNVRLGRHCVIAGLAGIAGSSRLGDGVMMGGQSGLAGHLAIGDGVRVAAHSGVMRSLDPGLTVMGTPAIPIRAFFRQGVVLSRLSRKKEEQE